ncbi:hypothetical protein SKAU_G00163340 [Synaphobranchus kaupii]|uniref:Uncharacterized protein n=1 Tax=Synaphobranchus kaupii TaxID=118154 RepID=A0A9Q1FIY3_SYNKA|nr:hypothetical protein SKAU_G00163340 [Synaphobranchus kaupii]
MGLQKFKMNIATTVISQDNASLQSMATDQLLNLFSLDKAEKGESSAAGACSAKASMKSVLTAWETCGTSSSMTQSTTWTASCTLCSSLLFLATPQPDDPMHHL